MDFISTNKKSKPVSFKQAVVQGMPEDGGLYMPEKIPRLSGEFFDQIEKLSYSDIGTEIARHYVSEDIPEDSLYEIIDSALNFEIPLIKLSKKISSLELFHGPTMAFKDVGARFMARCMGYFSMNETQEFTVLVATSGDTGSAVAHGFYNVNGIRVVILYPKGKISDFQERQMTRLGKNITALEVDGTFDDCQHLVKSAFKDNDIKKTIKLTSANSINIARLIPQIFYYFIGTVQRKWNDLIISVPSGNYGNLTAGLMAKRMGLKVKKFVASSNLNDIVPQYLQTGEYRPKPSITTISNAMDVGNPSNFARMSHLYNGSRESMREDLMGFSFNDAETRNMIWRIRDKYDYIPDPHGAVGILGLRKAFATYTDSQGIFLETAHPIKFKEVIEPVLEEKLKFPEGFKADTGTKQSIPIENDFQKLKEILI